MAERYFGKVPLTVDPATNTGMTILYTPQSDVGADRIVNAVAAYEMFGRTTKAPVIAVDFGTATTFDVISAAGEYIGGVICPGIGISADALFQRAARLPRVDVRKPPSIIGQTTVTSMQAGLFFGYVSMVDGIVQRIRAELPDGDRATCIATGGMAGVLAQRNRRDRARRAGPHAAGAAADLGTGTAVTARCLVRGAWCLVLEGASVRGCRVRRARCAVRAVRRCAVRRCDRATSSSARRRMSPVARSHLAPCTSHRALSHRAPSHPRTSSTRHQALRTRHFLERPPLSLDPS